MLLTMTDKISITRQTITAPSRKLTATWSIETEKPPFPLKGVKEMTEEEQADEIVRRLSQPYKTPAERLEDEMMSIMSMKISKAIDDEIIEEMKRVLSVPGHIINAKESNS